MHRLLPVLLQVKLPNWEFPGSAVFFSSISLGAIALLSGCALVQSPTERVETIAKEAGMAEVALQDRRLRGFAKASAGARLTVYIESDGAPWISRDQPPYDPTPIKPVVLHMAAADASASVAYLGRPCQYLSERELDNCDPALWTLGRYSEDAVAASQAAVDLLKRRAGAQSINLVGYSGGGAMAALVAARRQDVACLVTLAAPLDTNAWADAIGVTRLRLSLNPADYAERLMRVPQTHFVGARDITVPAGSIRRFIEKTPAAKVLTLERFTHTCCWEDEWKELRNRSCLVE